MIRRFVVACLALAAAGVVVPTAPAAQAQSWYDGPCTDDVGVTVVVDFQELGGGVNVRCAPRSVSSGLDALDAAGIAWEGTLRFPGFVCRIAGKPGADREACGNTPPASAYWGYWLAPRGGTWCYSNLGPANRTPPAGTVEGWSFALDRAPADVPPPRYAPPPIGDQPPVALNPSDCGVPSPAPPPPTTTAPTTTPPAATSTTTTSPPTTSPAPTSPPTTSPPITSPAPNDVPTTPATSLAQAPADPTTGEPADEQLTPDASVPSTSPVPSPTERPTTNTRPPRTTSPDPTVTTTTEQPRTPSPSTTDEELSELAETAGDTPSDADGTAALGTVDLGDDGRSGGDFGAGTALGFLLVGVLAATAAVVARQRRGSR